ncbi:MAG: hypothetical protein ACOC43_03745 [Desulfohalobiaceae bacterium]
MPDCPAYGEPRFNKFETIYAVQKFSCKIVFETATTKEIDMQKVMEEVSALIEHFKEEKLQKENRCFYCGGLHKTVACESHQKEAFHQNLAALLEEEQSLETETLQGEDMGFSNQQMQEYVSDFDPSPWQEPA